MIFEDLIVKVKKKSKAHSTPFKKRKKPDGSHVICIYNFLSGLFRLMIRFTNDVCVWTFFLATFMLDDFYLERKFACLSLRVAASNVTMPYAEISTKGILVYCCGGVVFAVFVFQIFIILKII